MFIPNIKIGQLFGSSAKDYSGAGPGGPPGSKGGSGWISGGLPGSQGGSGWISGGSSDVVDDVPSYLEGLFASSGKENEENRQYNSAEAKLNRDFQSEEAQIQRDWYEAMSNSAYQRSVADMRKAGINPILAYSQGGAASSGTGIATGSAASYNVNGADRLSDVLSAAADVVNAVAGASGASVSKAFKIFRMAGG